MTNQEVFDKCVSFLRKQGCASLSEKGFCSYFGPDGKRCAVGVFIEENEYKPEFEGDSLNCRPLIQELMRNKGIDLRLLDRLQDVHDGYMFEEWEEQFLSVADAFELEYTRKV